MKRTSRREFVQTVVKASVITSVGVPFMAGSACSTKTKKDDLVAVSTSLQFTQLQLPYDYAALEPHIDAQTMDIHYNKHHAAYVKNVNEALAEASLSFRDEFDLFKNISTLSVKVRNNGGGAWNHNFFWQIMKPEASEPGSKLLDALAGTFGSMEKFKEQFTTAAMTRFGSGWAWLVEDNGALKIGSTPNQDNPLMDVSDLRGTPLLALDVWEHAYYLKYQNKRNEYVANWWNLVHWDEVARRL